jgi:type II secretory pathway predicted ATPase ExeA
MYNSFYGFAKNPFDKQQVTEDDHFVSQDFEQMTSRLNYLKDIRGIGLFTAPPGMGKSYCLRCFLNSLHPNDSITSYVPLSTVSVAEFYKQLCGILGVRDRGGKTTMFKAIQEQIRHLYSVKRTPLILALDEAQCLSTGVLNDLKMLMNFGCDSLNCFTLILCGEPYLNDTLDKPIHEALRQRITIHYNYQGLSDDEIAAYLMHKIRIGGAAESIIDNAAISVIHSYSKGNARLIDNVMTDAITIGAQNNKKVIDAAVIQLAIENQRLG